MQALPWEKTSHGHLAPLVPQAALAQTGDRRGKESLPGFFAGAPSPGLAASLSSGSLNTAEHSLGL